MMERRYKSISQIIKMFQGNGVNGVIRKFCGKKLASGSTRTVWVLKQNPNYVIKIVKPKKLTLFPNVAEWINFHHNQYSELGKYLAPIEFINEAGTAMVQQRANWKGKKKGDYPKVLPHELCDLQYSNYGWIGEQFVCFDYPLLLHNKAPNTMRKVRWRTAHYKGTKKPAKLEDQVEVW